jgi:hypothetical protein
VYAVVEEQSSPTFRKAHKDVDPQKHKGKCKYLESDVLGCLELSAQLFASTYPHLLEGFNVLLESR